MIAIGDVSSSIDRAGAAPLCSKSTEKPVMTRRLFFNRSLLAGLFLGGALALAVGYGPAIAQGVGARPSTIATVRLSTVLEKLDQRAEALATMNAERQRVTADENRRVDEITKLQQQLDATRKELGDRAPTSAVVSLQEQVAQKTLQYQAWARFTADRIDIEKALLWQDLYRSIKVAAQQMASANGYALVLVDDSQGELTTSAESRVPREQQVMSQIVGRRMLYANPQLDITDDLITRMNNAFKAAGAARTTEPRS